MSALQFKEDVLSQKSELNLTLCDFGTDDLTENPCPPVIDPRRQQELERLIERHRPLIRKLCAGYATRREDAEDLESTVILTACRRYGTYSAEKGTFGTWLGAIVRNEAADIRRRARRQPVCVPSDEFTEHLLASIAAPSDFGEADQAFQAFELTPLLRRAFELVKLRGMTCAEAGRVMGKTEGTVRTYVWKARQAMRTHALAD